MNPICPRLVVAGTGGDAGKSLVSLALVAALRARGMRVAAFKKGPDYIDRAWLEWASGREARNLDTLLMGPDRVRASCAEAAAGADLAVVEGNRGLYDGLDALGKHSTAELAKLLDAPVVLLVDATKTTRTAAAVALGMQALDRDCPIAGVVLNRVAGSRHEQVLRESITRYTGLPVLGAIPRQPELRGLLPDRHLGLVTPAEHPDLQAIRDRLVALATAWLDLDGLLAVARSRPGWEAPPADLWPQGAAVPRGTSVRVGYLSDRAFTFYYPENLEALRRAGAELVPISAIDSPALPRIDALYLGGGFPEIQAEALAANDSFRHSVREAVQAGLPTYAECGGLMYLAQAFRWQGREHAMAGVLPLRLEVGRRPQGHGYVEVALRQERFGLPSGARLWGHEFHYSQVSAGLEQVEADYAVLRGTGLGDGRDGLRLVRGVAAYLHLHALSVPGWAPWLVGLGAAFRAKRTTRQGLDSAGKSDRKPGRRTQDDVRERKHLENSSE